MSNPKLFAAAVLRASLIAMTAFTLVVAVRVLGGELLPGHPPAAVEECPQLPPGHPVLDEDLLPGLPPGHPPVRILRLPPGHPPIDDAPPPMPVLSQDGTSTT